VQTSGIVNASDISTMAGPVDAFYAWPSVEPLLIQDVNKNFVPWLAERFEIAADSSSVTFYLRHGIKFHDGTDFTSEAVKVVIDIARSHTGYTQGHKWQSPVIIDDYTVRLDFVDGKWDWDAFSGLAGWWGMWMFSPTYLQTNDAEYKKTHMIGTGPFIFKEYKRDQIVIYDRNPDYWRGAPYFEGIDYQIIPDPTTQLLAYKAGELTTLAVQLKDVQRLKDEGFSVLESNDVVIASCVVPSSKDPNSPLNKLAVRQAVQYAIDQDTLIAGLTYGLGHPTQQEMALPPYRNDSVVGYPYNPAEARRLLEENGYGTGLTLTLSYSEGFGSADLPLAIKDMFSEVGINIEFNKVSYLASFDLIFGSGWPDGFMLSGSFLGDRFDPGFTEGMFMQPGAWVSTLQPQEVLDLLAQAASEPDSVARAAIFQQISKLKTDLCLNQYMYWTPGFTSISPFVTGYTIGLYTEFFAWTYAYFTE